MLCINTKASLQQITLSVFILCQNIEYKLKQIILSDVILCKNTKNKLQQIILSVLIYYCVFTIMQRYKDKTTTDNIICLLLYFMQRYIGCDGANHFLIYF